MALDAYDLVSVQLPVSGFRLQTELCMGWLEYDVL